MSDQTSKPVVVIPTKSVGISVLLTVLFGPLGMLYSTVGGAIVMILVNLVVGFLTAGLGLLLTWPICVVWGVMAVNAHNRRLLAGSQG